MALQNFHDATSMIPSRIYFNVVDIKGMSDDRAVIAISSVHLESHT